VADPRRRTVIQAGGRAKAYRPIALEARRHALAEGLAAYDRGDFFEAHELLEPAWMGTDDLGERGFLQGLIKLAAAFVHATRGNALGLEKNLRGAHTHLSVPGATAWGRRYGVDLPALVAAVDGRLAAGGAAGAGSIEIPRMPSG